MPAAAPLPWPDSLAGTPAVAVIERAVERRRLSHSLLITGDDLELLEQVALSLADRLLNTPESSARFAPASHPDFFALRPAGKMRQISADTTRELIGKVQVSPTVALRKVAVITECDRMNTAAANIFLKTLEEPPANTTLILLTSRPYALLDTIRSRCLNFRFPSVRANYSPDGWSAWLQDYAALLEKLSGGIAERAAIADSVFMTYGLSARFGTILENAVAEVWKRQRATLPEEMPEEEQVAIETGIANGLRARLFAEIAGATRDYALTRLVAGDEIMRRQLTEAISRLEHDVGLLRVNLKESVALEDFLLASLRIWTRR